jgi:hypothetical protein
VFAAAVVTALASSPLGFNYTRDRFGGMAAVFYAMAAYFALRHACDRITAPSTARSTAPFTTAPRRVYALTAVVVLAVAWQLRAVGTIEAEHARASGTRRGWMAGVHQVWVDRGDRRRYVAILDAMTEQGTDLATATPARYPEWTAPWLR